MLNNISIRSKLLGNSAILLALVIICSGIGLFAMNQLAKDLESIAKFDIPLTNNLTLITEHQLEQAIHVERALRYGLLAGESTEYTSKLNKEIAYFDSLSKQIGEELAAAEVMAAKAIQNAHNPKETKQFKQVETSLNNIEKHYQSFEKLVETVFGFLVARDNARVLAYINQVEQEEDALYSELKTLLDKLSQFTAESALNAEAREKAALKTLLVITVMAIVIGVFTSWAVSSNLIQRLEHLVHNIEFLASGDMTRSIKVDGKDEIGQLKSGVKTMSANLNSMIKQVDRIIHELSDSSVELAKAATQSHENTESQQAETGMVATAMNEMTATVAEVAENTSTTSTASETARNMTQETREVQLQSVSGMEQLVGKIENASEAIIRVEQDSENINTVLEVIKSIAEQTNLLALNAAIEAARAGEQGRGFAVVADEVRTLAGRTQESTEEIHQMIEALQSSSQQAVAMMHESKEQTTSVFENTNLADTKLSEVEKSVAVINDMSVQIATAAEEQSLVANEINQNIVRISEFSSINSEKTSKSLNEVKELEKMATDVRDLVEQFKV